MKAKRNLSGIYIRYYEEDGTWGNRVFEDLDEKEQREVLSRYDIGELKRIIILLASTINDIGEQLDLEK